MPSKSASMLCLPESEFSPYWEFYLEFNKLTNAVDCGI
jgi:hypothetical protein